MTSTTSQTGPVPNAAGAMPSVVSPYIGGWALVARTFGVTAVAVPLSVYLLVPRLMRLAGGIHRGRP